MQAKLRSRTESDRVLDHQPTAAQTRLAMLPSRSEPAPLPATAAAASPKQRNFRQRPSRIRGISQPTTHTHPLEQRRCNDAISLPHSSSTVRQLTSCDVSVRLSVAA